MFKSGLADLGFRVPIYDLYGRGYSDRVTGAQDVEFYVRQFEDLLTDRGVDEEIALLGYSMGGAIATAFAARHPGRIRHPILLASVGMGDSAGHEAIEDAGHGLTYTHTTETLAIIRDGLPRRPDALAALSPLPHTPKAGPRIYCAGAAVKGRSRMGKCTSALNAPMATPIHHTIV
ncbi:MAG: alpha/beta fold hydrolase [Rhodobacteraceae bacterium]|nr:alpha/beta fold hydrolase [Paracoccaceae bacterium]